MSGFFPHFVVAKTQTGLWAGFLLSTNGYTRITGLFFSPVDAAKQMAERPEMAMKAGTE